MSAPDQFGSGFQTMSQVGVQNLVKKFKEKTAVGGISFEIEAGEVFGLLGPNGAGKSTTISILTTLLLPTSGQATVCGLDVVRESRRVRQLIGLVFQETILDEDLSAYSNLDIHARLYHLPRAVSETRIKELLALVGLASEARVRASKFSGGMKRRLEIARGLIHRPQVLFLDEPTIGLDPRTRRLIWQYIKQLNAETKLTILLTTHYLEEADFLCHRVAVMNEGRLAVCGTPKQLKQALGGDLVRLRLADVPDDLAVTIKRFPFVRQVAVRGQEVSLTMVNGEANVAELLKLINQRRLDIKSFHLQEPTLEDVFLHYTGQKFNGLADY